MEFSKREKNYHFNFSLHVAIDHTNKWYSQKILSTIPNKDSFITITITKEY